MYKTEEGHTPVLAAIKTAETALIAEQNSGLCGPWRQPGILQAMSEMVFAQHLPAINERLAWAQTPGGCGALRVAAEIIKKPPGACIWVSDPTWGTIFRCWAMRD